jgi:hypothetical protein
MKEFNSKTFYHRDEVTRWLNDNQCIELISITWIGSFWVVFYYCKY